MKATLLSKLSKAQLRSIVGKIKTIDDKKLSKMSKNRCLTFIDSHDLSYNQLKDLSKD